MAADDRRESDPVVAALLERPHRFEFFQAVELIERRYGKGESLVGRFVDPREEVLRFRPNASLGFPRADVESAALLKPSGEAGDHPVYRLTVNFTGLYGPSSPLPAYYTEAILAHDDAESARRDFMDIFHHRIVSLLYRLWVKYRYFLRYRQGAEDDMSNMAFALFGLGAPEKRKGMRLRRRERLMSSLGLLSMSCRSPKMLASIISDYFDGIAVDIICFIPRRLDIPHDQRMQLGTANCHLGRNTSLGRTVDDIGALFRLAIGPAPLADLARFLPNGADHDHLIELVNCLLRDPLDFDMQLNLTDDAVPPLILAGDRQCRLGWTSWLGHVPQGRHEIVFSHIGRRVRLPEAAGMAA